MINSYKRDVYKIYCITFIANLQFFGAITISFFKEWSGLNFQKIFILESFYTLFLFLLEIPNGIFADRFTKKSSLSLGLCFLGLGYFIFSFTKDFYMFIIAEFLCACGAAFLSGSDKALLYDILKKNNLEEHAKIYFARLQGWGIFGMAIALPMGSYFSKSHFLTTYPNTLPLTFLFSGLFCLIFSFFALSIKEKREIKNQKKFFHTGIESLKIIWNNKVLLRLALNLSMINAPTFFIVYLYQPLLSQSGVDIKFFGMIACIFNMASIFLLRNIEKFERIFGLKKLLFYCGILPGILLLFLAIFKNSFLVIPFIILAASIKSLRAPIINDYINAEIGSTSRTTILSSIAMIQRIISFFLNIMIGFLLDISISGSLFLLGSMTVFFSFVFKNKIKTV